MSGSHPNPEDGKNMERPMPNPEGGPYAVVQYRDVNKGILEIRATPNFGPWLFVVLDNPDSQSFQGQRTASPWQLALVLKHYETVVDLDLLRFIQGQEARQAQRGIVVARKGFDPKAPQDNRPTSG